MTKAKAASQPSTSDFQLRGRAKRSSRRFTGQSYGKARSAGFRSGLEIRVAHSLRQRGQDVIYEQDRLKYTPTERTYTPDFRLRPGVYVECKGLFTGSDRAKHLLIQKQHPDIEVRFVFSNPNARLYSGSNTTYAEWCNKHGFKYAKGDIPNDWLTR